MKKNQALILKILEALSYILLIPILLCFSLAEIQKKSDRKKARQPMYPWKF